MSLENEKVAMVIMAHPDDAEFGAGGTIAAWAREGWNIYYVVCTDGAGGGPDEAIDVGPEARKKITETRKKEQREAAGVLGAKDVLFLDYPDGLLMPSLELRRDLVRMLRHYRPQRVVCQSPERTWSPYMALGRHHPDHLASGQAALAAIYPAAQNPWDFPELLNEGLLPHRVKEVFIAGAPTVNFAVDISETLDLKLAALKAHTSQTSASFENIEKFIKTRLAEAGTRNNFGFAEEFHRTEN